MTPSRSRSRSRSRLRRPAGRAPLAAGALALAALACPGSPPGDGAPLAPGQGAKRLGPPSGYAKFGGVVRPVMPRTPGRASVEVRDLPPGRVHFAAAFAAPPPERDAADASCRVTLEGAGAPPLSLRLSAPAPGTSPLWVEASAALPGVPRATLAFDCEGGAHAVWARPLWVPLAVPEPPPLVVLLSLDTLRADHVTGFGGAPGLTPNLEGLGAQGVRLASASAEGTWTVPSHFALFYSRLFGYPVEDAPLASLAETLAAHGFVALGLTGGGFMGSAWKFHRGFDLYTEYATYGDPLPRVLADALHELRRFASSPTFLYVHTYAVHRQTPKEMEWGATHGFGRPFAPDAGELEEARALYRDLVRQTDADLQPFLSALAGVARERPTLLVLVSDHGEAFGEHGNFRHGSGGPPRVTLHDELVRVPGMVWAPGLVPPGRTLERAVGLVDVAPSLLSAAGIPSPPGMRGADLWPAWSGSGAASPRSGGVSETRDSWSLRGPERKLIVTLRSDDELDFELYDLAGDPRELDDLADAEPGVVRSMLARLRRERARLGAPGDGARAGLAPCPYCKAGQNDAFWRQALAGGGADGPDLDPETRRRLRDLGYAETD